MAPELDRGYGPLFAALRGKVHRTRPSIEVILQLLCPTNSRNSAPAAVRDSARVARCSTRWSSSA